MSRLFAFALITTLCLNVCWLNPCFAQLTPVPPVTNPIINPPYDGSGFAKMWTYRTGTDDTSRRALAFRIEGTSGENLQGKLSMYKVKEIESGKYFEKKKLKVSNTNIDAYTIDCTLEPNQKKTGYLIKAQANQGSLVRIGVISTTPNGTFVMIKLLDNNVFIDNEQTPIQNPCDEPPEIGEEERVAIGIDSSTPGPTLPITAPPKVNNPAAATAIAPN